MLAAHDHVADIVKPHMMYSEIHNAAYTTLAEGLAGGGRNRERARARVNRLVREVDRCIALLNRQQE